MWDGIKTYDSDKNDNFKKYIQTAIDNRLKSAIRSENTGKNQININAKSMDEPSGTDDEDGGRTYNDTLGSNDLTPEEKYLGKDGAERLIKFMKTELADKERDVIFRFINGNTIPEISNSTGMSYKSVENALMRARNKIKEYKAKNESKKHIIGITLQEMEILNSIMDKLSLLG